MKRLKLIVSPLAKGQTQELKTYYKTMYGLSVAQKVYLSIKDNLLSWYRVYRADCYGLSPVLSNVCSASES